MPTKRTDHPAAHPRAPRIVENTTDATQGQPLAVRAELRKDELRDALEKLPAAEEQIRGDIKAALASIDTMLTGDIEHLSEATAAEVNRWLESSKHLGERAKRQHRSTKH